MKTYDYIVIGSGLAGLYSAYKASDHNRTVALITKADLKLSNSYYAQGGIAAVTTEDDTPKFHFKDTIIAGRNLCDYPAVDILVNEGPDRIQEIIEDGMHFDMDRGNLALGLEGGHNKHRILHAGGDSTGRLITEFMISKILSVKNIEIFEYHEAIQLLIDDHGCYGVCCRDFKSDKNNIFIGKNVFLASGGASGIYKRNTNPKTTIGEGLAMCYDAGCKIVDIEFEQFHPTAIYTTDNSSPFLVSEAVRGEGALLINQKGERFMDGIHPQKELAPRDVVARSIFMQMQKSGDDFVYLSLKDIDPNLIKKRFPTIFNKCQELGIDMTDKIPVAPAAHYMVGGVEVDLHGQTNIPNLYVIGELASTGIMGANRLASNSLLECLVFGHRAVQHSLNSARSAPITFKISEYCLYTKKELFDTYKRTKDKIASLMTQYAGIIRNESGLIIGMRKLDKLEEKLSLISTEYYSRVSQQLLTVARLMIEGALFRKESRGCHYREDFPNENDKFICHTVQQKYKPITAREVNFNIKD